MEQQTFHLVPAVIGGTAGFIGGAVAALGRETTVRRVLVAVLGGLGIGTFVAPPAVNWFSLPPEVAGVVGFLGGLGVFGIVEGVVKLTDRFGQNPERVLPQSIRDRLRDLSPPAAADQTPRPFQEDRPDPPSPPAPGEPAP
jgi:hypothetical protein